MMNIMHVTEVLAGGPATHLRELLPHQISRYNRVSLMCKEEDIKFLGDIPGLNIIAVPKVSRSARGLFRLAASIRAHARSHDLVHLHSSFAGLTGRLVLSRRRKRIVYCSRGWSFAMERPPVVRRVYAMAERILGFNSHHIINISDQEHALALDYGLPVRKMSVVYNGVSDRPWVPLTEPTARKLLFVGRYDEQKGVDLLVKAFPKLREMGFSLTMIGGHVSGKRQIAEIPPDIVDLGWRSPDQIAAAMGEAHAVVMPSRWEGFGFVAIEAMRAGRPLIASKTGGLADIVLDGTTGFHVEPGSWESIVDGATRLASADARMLGQAGRERYVSVFSSTTMCKNIDLIYSKIWHAP